MSIIHVKVIFEVCILLSSYVRHECLFMCGKNTRQQTAFVNMLGHVARRFQPTHAKLCILHTLCLEGLLKSGDEVMIEECRDKLVDSKNCLFRLGARE
jgi:hypothetical protein